MVETCFNVDIEATSTGPRFAFRNERTGAAVPVQSIHIVRLTENGDDLAGACGISSGAGQATTWTYGELPAGYERKGDCDPLPQGKYRVLVYGHGSAARLFAIEADGKVTADAATCD